VRDLAAMAHVTPATITRFENERGGLNSATVEKLKSTLTEAGIIFLDEGAITPGGAGVRLRSIEKE